MNGRRALYEGVFTASPFQIGELRPPLEVPKDSRIEVFDNGRLIGTLVERDGFAEPALH